MPISKGNIIFQCDGGPGGREESVDESYSEEDDEEETSSTSVEDEEESEEEDDTDEEEEEVEEDEGEEERNIKRPTRNSGPPQSPQQTTSRVNNSEALQRGRVTRQKAREAMPTKRLLRSRNKSPLPPRPGSRVNQVFKCPNCRKEFNNKASLSRHMGWCKQKPAKDKSPRKKKGDEIKKETPKQEEIGHVIAAHSSSSSAPNTPRGRGRPKKNSVPSVPTPPSSKMVNKAEEDFMQQRSPESSPGMLDTSSEEDYEQKEFAANAHQLISHRNSSCSSGPIDVVNPDPDPSIQTEGPVTCPQCKMTYRTLAGFQNHIPTCAPYSSDEDSEDDDDDEVDVVHSEASHFQHQNVVNWGVHQTISETIIAPSPQSPPPPPMQVHQPMSEENSEESNNSSDGLGNECDVIDEASLHTPQQQTVNIPHVIAPLPQPPRYVPISPKVPVETSPSKVVGGIRLPLDNTPQVINASGLTLERVESPQIVLNSPLRNGLEPVPKNSPVHQVTATPTPPPFEHHQTPPPPHFHAVQPSHPSTQSSYSSPIYTQSSAFQSQPHHHHHSLPITSLPTTTAATAPGTSASSMPFSLLQQAHASGNPPTYTQAQLMPGTIVHNSMMQVPQQMSTSSGDTYHQPVPPQTQQLLQQQNYATPQSFLNYAANQGIPQQVFRYPNGIPSSGIHSMAGQHQAQIFQQQQIAFAQGQMLRHPVSLDQQQRMQIPPQQMPQYLNPATGTLEQIPGQLQGPTPGQNVGTYGLSTNPNQVNFAHLQQSNGQMQQLGTVNPSQAMSFQAQQSNMILQQQMTAPQQPIQASHSQVNSQLPSQNHPNLPQHQMQQLQYPFYQNQTSLPKLDMQGGGQQPIQQVPQYSIMPQQNQTVGNGTGGLPIGVPMHIPPQQNPQLQQQHLTHPAQQQLANVSNIFSQFANSNQPQPIPPQGTSISASQPPSENSGPVQVQQQQLSQSMLQPNAMNMAQTQVELNLQQQSQLQQQQQQFMALQQQQILAAQAQQQQQQSSNRNTPQQMQITPQNLQALMMNPSALQWGKPQTLTQAPQQVASTVTSPGTQQTIQSQPQQASGTTQQQQQILPQQVIQQIAQVTDNAGNTYIIITQPQQGTQNGMPTGNNASQVVNLVPGLQTLQCQQQQQQMQRPSSAVSQCSANGTPSHSPSSSSVGSVGKSAPCPCATCLEKVANPHMDKYKKVLPYPSSSDHLKPIAPLLAPKQPVSIRPAISKQPLQPKVIRVQTANSPRPSTVALLQPNAIQHGSQLRMVTVQQQQQLGLLAPTTPNIAVVRPMENPLQRLSDQISQIESTFLSTPPPQPQVLLPTSSADNQPSPPYQGPHFTLVNASPPISSASPPQLVHVATTASTPISVDVTESSHQQNIDSILNMPTPRLGLVDHGISPVRHPSTPTPSTTPLQLTPNGNTRSPSSGVENGSISSETSSTSGVKRKILEVSPSSSGGGSAAKSIKLLLNRKGGGDTYTVNKIAGASPKGTMRNLKIKGKIKSGEQEGTETEVVVVPSIHFVPIPDPDANEMEGNRTIAEDGQQTANNNNGSTSRQNLRLVSEAVVPKT